MNKDEIINFLHTLQDSFNYKEDKESIEDVIILTELYFCGEFNEPCGLSICGDCHGWN